MNEQQYIEHEVQIRVLKETTDCKFVSIQKNFEDKFALFQKNIDDRFAHIDYKINIIIGIGIAALLIPLLKSALGFI
jgi:hypothetical protein